MNVEEAEGFGLERGGDGEDIGGPGLPCYDIWTNLRR